MHGRMRSEGGVGADEPTRTCVPRRHCRVCHRVDSGAHLTDARHPSQTMAIHPNRDIRGHQGAGARRHASRPDKRDVARCATFLGEPPVTSEEAPSAMGMWGLHGGSCAPAGFPVTRCVGCFLHATDATTPHWPLSPACAGEIPGLTTAHNDTNKVSVMCLTPSYRGPGTTSTGVNFRWPFGMLPVYLLHRRSSIAARYESADFQRPDASLRRTRYIRRRSRDMLADWSSRASRIDDDLPQAHGIVRAPLEALPAHDGVYRRR